MMQMLRRVAICSFPDGFNMRRATHESGSMPGAEIGQSLVGRDFNRNFYVSVSLGVDDYLAESSG